MIFENLLSCDWCRGDELYQRYHDEEWGLPCHHDRKLFEFLILEGAQAGLSWITVLKKREGYRLAFDGFDPEKIARYDEQKIKQLTENKNIIRNQLKIKSAVKNAQAYLNILDLHDSFDKYMWQFVDGTPIVNHYTHINEVPVTTPISDTMSKVLKRDGFSFVGSTICYAYMQAMGMVNDHLVTCPRHQAVQQPFAEVAQA